MTCVTSDEPNAKWVKGSSGGFIYDSNGFTSLKTLQLRWREKKQVQMSMVVVMSRRAVRKHCGFPDDERHICRAKGLKGEMQR